MFHYNITLKIKIYVFVYIQYNYRKYFIIANCFFINGLIIFINFLKWVKLKTIDRYLTNYNTMKIIQ